MTCFTEGPKLTLSLAAIPRRLMKARRSPLIAEDLVLTLPTNSWAASNRYIVRLTFVGAHGELTIKLLSSRRISPPPRALPSSAAGRSRRFRESAGAWGTFRPHHPHRRLNRRQYHAGSCALDSGRGSAPPAGGNAFALGESRHCSKGSVCN